MSILDTWLGSCSPRDNGGNVRSDKAPTYADVRLPVDPIERGAPVGNPPKAVEAYWVIGFVGASSKPFAKLHCSCRTATHFDLSGDGVTPVARCCKKAPSYPQDRKHTAHLLYTGTVPDGNFGGRAADLPPEPGTALNTEYKPPIVQTTVEQDMAFINRLIDKDLAGAAKDAEAIDAAYKEHQKHLK